LRLVASSRFIPTPFLADRSVTAILPQIVYSLQNMEFFHHARKQLLCDRGVLPAAIMGDATLQLSADEKCHVDFINQRVLRLLDRLGMPRNPMTAARAGA
jgi:hypothetical protein